MYFSPYSVHCFLSDKAVFDRISFVSIEWMEKKCPFYSRYTFSYELTSWNSPKNNLYPHSNTISSARPINIPRKLLGMHVCKINLFSCLETKKKRRKLQKKRKKMNEISPEGKLSCGIFYRIECLFVI